MSDGLDMKVRLGLITEEEYEASCEAFKKQQQAERAEARRLKYERLKAEFEPQGDK